MTRWRAAAVLPAVAAGGALGTLAVGAALGMDPGQLLHLGLTLAPALALSVAAALAARPLLLRAPIRRRLVATALVASLLTLANLTALSFLMFVSDRDATLLAALVLYSMGSGIGVALVQAAATSRAIARLAATATRLASGDLTARTGDVAAAGPELEALGRTLDEMAGQLADSMERARDAESRRRDLMTAISHDLRTPLSDLRAMIEAIDDGVVEDAPSLRRYAAEMRRAVGSLVLLVDDLFELTQLDMGRQELDSERVPLRDLVGSVLATCAVQARMKGLVVGTSIESAADAACSPRMARVLQNLVQNAIRHTPADGSVVILAQRGPAELEIAVEDTGEGIPAESLDRVFEPSWRGDPARVGTGSGLGLALARRIVEGLGGSIRVESGPSRGARFRVVVPIV